MEIKNRKAKYDYEILETYIAGIILTGTEMKSIRAGKASIVDTHCTVDNNEVWLRNSFINKFELGTYNNHEEKRPRKLLLNKKEIRTLEKEVQIKGNTIVPLKMFINKRGYCKVEIALCKGKKDYDKRQTIKERDNKRELDKIMKSF